MAARHTSIHDVPETQNVFERTLPDGNKLEYRMRVLQQPERARACGMGAKSHADRRPVDPPPVVELSLFQGTGPEKADVTFSHNSNFLLFATLEPARPIAQGRGMPAPAPAPVLTGVPVSGMAYLDRPAPAGYFIFPDLSVRHEGRYRLRFALYEETKEEIYPLPADPLEPREFCTHRLDVKSKAFTVFSAKKFPGLAESTALSRIVAEQGCRVRIRRDVRMRRRNERTRRESEDGMDETAMIRAQRHHTPDQYEIESQIRQQNQFHQPPAHPMQRSESIDRKRSGSDASIASINEVPAPPRFDGSGYVTPNQNHGPYGPPTSAAHTSGQYLTFRGQPAPLAPPQVHPPQQLPSQDLYRYQPVQQSAPPPPPQQTGYMQPSQGYQHRDNSMGLPSQHQHLQPQPPMNPSLSRRGSTDYATASRRESNAGGYNMAPQVNYRPTTPSYSTPMSNGYGQQQQQAYAPPPPPQQPYQPVQQQSLPLTPSSASQSAANALPPLRLPPMEPNLKQLWNSQPTTPNGTAPPALPSPSAYGPPTSTTQPQLQPSVQPQQRAPQVIPSQLPQAPAPPHPNQFPSYYPDAAKLSSTAYSQQPPPPPQADNRKRPWGRVFNTAHTEGPLYDGGRPSVDNAAYGSDAVSANGFGAADDEDEYDIGKLKMSYRRADGAEIVRRLPGGDI